MFYLSVTILLLVSCQNAGVLFAVWYCLHDGMPLSLDHSNYSDERSAGTERVDRLGKCPSDIWDTVNFKRRYCTELGLTKTCYLDLADIRLFLSTSCMNYTYTQR